jgi:hypothetical protein
MKPLTKSFALRASLWGLGIAASITTPLAQARDCGCGDLPGMVQELAQYEFLQKKFQDYADYTPTSFLTITDMQQAATNQMNAAFYGTTASAGTSSGAHAALGTDIHDASCPILEYLYDKKGRAILDKDGNQKSKIADEKTYNPSQCSGRTRADFAHERAHVATCQRLVQTNKTNLWSRLSFFAADDAAAYKAGADVLREEIKPLAQKCGWDNSTKNRLPNIQEAQDLAKRAAKARPKRRKK